MSQINPILVSLAATPLAQRLASAERDADIHRSRRILKTGSPDDADGDMFIESADAADAVDNDLRRERENPRHGPPEKPPEQSPEPDDEPHLDIQG